MKKQIFDWKDIAESYYDKSVSLAILILLFAFIVSPKIEVKPYDRTINIIDAVDIPPEIKERIKPPEETVRPVVEIVIEEDLDGEDDEDIEIIETIGVTSLDPYEEIQEKILGQTSKFAIYEDEPFPIRKAPLEYPVFAKNAGIEGEVILQVEVFTDGTVGAIEILKSLMSGPGGLDEVAVKSVKNWEFSPAKSGGKPVACWVTFPVGFYLN
ncbi:MAG: energy transducer TonB [Candidatus Cloacimonetes bacterium]|jgi:protein TonB|nr:energy transducer TonB [Candidatus Cloacimonadota bacterium]MBT4334137.1 energy transducer TonB [Candidatus Cloacimonadota bacterium]MBT4575869.1 energy transducer TonB [Candidatus Cloacimonadota bacterium]MBT5420219.1 energy transducer TonB [Candidatus Cloacimonadota bacterium]